MSLGEALIPTDPALPTLDAALDLSMAAPALVDAVPGLAAVHAVRLVRHKPERRAVLEYDVDLHGEPVTLMAKIRRLRSGSSGFRLASALEAEGIPVPEPVAAVKPLKLWLQRKVPGTVATELVGSADGPALAAAIARESRRVHGCAVSPKRAHTMADELDILQQRFALLAATGQAPEERLARLLQACWRLAATVPSPTPCPIHRDFYADQVVVDADRLWLLDFDLFCAGDPALDAGNFVAHLTEQALREHGDARALKAVESAFEEAFVADAGEGSRRSVDVYATLTLARHVQLSSVIPGREHLTLAVLELCEERLGLASGGAR